MNGISLFTGSAIGEMLFMEIIPDYRTVAYVENNPFCIAHIIKSIKAGLIDDAPIYDDVRDFDGLPYQGMVDLVSGGFPCQPFSIAGKRQGSDDHRNMWPDTKRIISEIRPRYAFLENVPALLSFDYIRRVFGDLAEIGYDCEWDTVSAAFAGANHLRRRLWIIAHDPKQCQLNKGKVGEVSREEQTTDTTGVCSNDSDPNGTRQLQSQGVIKDERLRVGDIREEIPDTTSDKFPWSGDSWDGWAESPNCDWWEVEPNVGRVGHGLAFRRDRLAMLGNGWCPQTVARILDVTETE